MASSNNKLLPSVDTNGFTVQDSTRVHQKVAPVSVYDHVCGCDMTFKDILNAKATLFPGFHQAYTKNYP